MNRLINIRDQFVVYHVHICQKNCIQTLPTHLEMSELRRHLHEISLNLARKLRQPRWKRFTLEELHQEALPCIASVTYMEGYIQAVFNIHLQLMLPNVSFYVLHVFMCV